MGCSQTINQSSTSALRCSFSALSQSERVLWYDIRNYNFDSKNFELLVLFQSTYCDLKGNMISPYLASILVLELKRFFFLCVLCIQNQNKIDPPHQLPKVSDLVPSPLVDRMWRLFISNTEAYELFSVSMFDFKLPRDSSKFTDIENYRNTRKLMTLIFGSTNPMIWPVYPSSHVLQLAHKGFMLMQTELVPSFFSYMTRKMSTTKRPIVFAINKLQQIRKKQALRNYPSDTESVSMSASNTLKVIDTDDENLDDDDSEEVSAKFLGFKEIAPFPKKMMLLLDQDKVENLTEKLSSLQFEEVKGHDFLISSLKSSKLDNEEELRRQTETLLDLMADNPIPPQIIKTFSLQVCVPLSVAEVIFEEYKKYLILLYFGSISSRFIYPPLVKRAWDYHLAQTVAYESFCKIIFREFLYPPLLPRKITASEMHDYDETLLAYQNLFRVAPPESVWVSSALRFIAEEKVFIHIGSFLCESQSEEELLNFYGLKEVEKAASEMETLSKSQ